MKFINLTLICLFLFASCSKEEISNGETIESNTETVNKKSNNQKSQSNFDDYEIYYVDEDSGQETAISLEEFKNFIRNFHSLASTVSVEDVEIVLDESNQDAIYASVPSEGDFAVFVDQDVSGNLKIGAKTCTCKGENCQGCNLSITGSHCSCSPCGLGGTCTKTESGSTGATYAAALFTSGGS